jgi:hypothetical protein
MTKYALLHLPTATLLHTWCPPQIWISNAREEAAAKLLRLQYIFGEGFDIDPSAALQVLAWQAVNPGILQVPIVEEEFSIVEIS